MRAARLAGARRHRSRRRWAHRAARRSTASPSSCRRRSTTTTTACFPMAPWAGRVRDGRFTFDGVEHQLPLNKPPHAIHGIVRDRRWEVDARVGHGRRSWSVELVDPWPFGGRVVQRARRSTSDSLALDDGGARGRRGRCPRRAAGIPGGTRDLTRGEAVELELHAGAMYVRDDDGHPDRGARRRCSRRRGTTASRISVSPSAVLRWPGAATRDDRDRLPVRRRVHGARARGVRRAAVGSTRRAEPRAPRRRPRRTAGRAHAVDWA